MVKRREGGYRAPPLIAVRRGHSPSCFGPAHPAPGSYRGRPVVVETPLQRGHRNVLNRDLFPQREVGGPPGCLAQIHPKLLSRVCIAILNDTQGDTP